MKEILLIRHGTTRGNLEGRYIGRTDEPLCAEGIVLAQRTAADMPRCDRLFTSPLLRCKQTAQLLFPHMRARVIDDLRECDFGRFENRTYDELARDADYRAWLAADCQTRIPGGEQLSEFQKRCCEAFLHAAAASPAGETAAFVTHGGCIMAILEHYAVPKRAFYEYRVQNCACVRCTLTGEELCIQEGLA